ncbi:DNA primase subunit pri2 [Diatrype stigma]|uniref:DNA primase subunit pri2 n=1 Tax=Diatrype stigma TaxID=117547 RepID=A0AAN9UVU7_9PEZI
MLYAHLKHYGRLQYTLFLKGIGLNLEECLLFWRSSFNKITDDTFNKEYRYNVRHAYGDVGGDSNRRGGGYSPFSCQKILTEHPPGPGETHGCPYRHFNLENLTALLQSTGISDRSVLQGVKEDKEKQKFHMACNRYVPPTLPPPFPRALLQVALDISTSRGLTAYNSFSVFEFVHKNEISKAKDEGVMTTAQLETIVHPNEYFKRSYLLKNLGKANTEDVKMEG